MRPFADPKVCPISIVMPELPEVETVRRGLVRTLKGAQIRDVELRRANLRAPFPKDFVHSLKGATVTGLRRRAKYLLADLDNGMVWLSHLGMSGSFTAIAKGMAYKPGTHDHVILTLTDGTKLVFNDPRRFGQMDAFLKKDESSHPALRDIGPEPLAAAFTGDVLKERLLGKKVAIKIALLDQKTVAGVGNIYASEALYRAGINPRKPAGKINRDNCVLLVNAIKDVLNDAIKSGGSTLRNYRQIDGNTGFFQHRFAVYDHEGERCPNCICGGKSKIKAFVQGGRTTFYCPVKQR
jgi:formamidopyrimidine-DNA glycosylase